MRTLLHWADAFVDGFTVAAGGSTAIFTYTDAFTLGGGSYVPKQYHERVNPQVEPIQGLDGGVRYASALLLFGGAYGGVFAPADAQAFAQEELPKVMAGLVATETLVLLPKQWAAVVRASLGESSDVVTKTLVSRVIDQEEAGDSILYYAASVYVLE